MWWLVSYFQKQCTRSWMWNKRLHCMQSKKLSVNFHLSCNKTWDCSGPCNMCITGKQADLCLCYLATCMACCDFADHQSIGLPFDCKAFLICEQVTYVVYHTFICMTLKAPWHSYCNAWFQAMLQSNFHITDCYSLLPNLKILWTGLANWTWATVFTDA